VVPATRDGVEGLPIDELHDDALGTRFVENALGDLHTVRDVQLLDRARRCPSLPVRDSGQTARHSMTTAYLDVGGTVAGHKGFQ
jgi:hypothetical protein